MTEREENARDRDEAARSRDEAARLRDERSRDRDEAAEAAQDKRSALTRSQGRWFVFQVVANIAVLGVLLILMSVAIIRISDINRQQGDNLRQQSNAQLCNQHDSLIALVTIADKLGLPTDDIAIPNVEGLNCP